MNIKLIKVIYLAIASLVLTSMFYTLIYNGFIKENELFIYDEDYYVLFNKTIEYTSSLTICIDARKPCLGIRGSELIKIHSLLNHRFNELLNKRGVEYYVLATHETYLNISRVNNILYNVSIDLNIIWSSIVKSTEELELMRIDNALKIYRSSRFVIEKILRDLERVLSVLENTDYHRYVYVEQAILLNNTLITMSSLFELLREYYELMSTLDRYRDMIYNIDSLRNVSQILLVNIDVNKLGYLSIKVSNFLSQLKALAESSGLTSGETTTVPYNQGVPYD